MYESFYGFTEKPFDLHPDPSYLYMSPVHEDVFTHLEYAVLEHKGFVLVTGDIGSGKTTLINHLLNRIPENTQVGLVNNTAIPAEEFLRVLCREYELNVNGGDKSELLEHFHRFLLERFANKQRVVLIVDEAQNLDIRMLEEIRLLSNLEAEKHHLIQIILAGQPELKEKFQMRALAQFAQRISVHCHLGALGKAEVREYIQHRLQVAGGRDPDLFSREAVEMVHEVARGIPRLVNILCDTALVYGYADERKHIGTDLIEQVIQARENSGLFTTREETGKVEEMSQERENSTEPPWEWRQTLQHRVLLLENSVLSLDRQIRRLQDFRDQRDQVMVELFRMLKGSMESRMRLATRLFYQTRQGPQNSSTPQHVEEGPKKPSGIFSCLRKGRTQKG